MKTTVKERITMLMESEKITKQNDFADHIGSKKGTVSNWFVKNAKPDIYSLAKIAQTFPTLNMRWLVTGEGQMYYDDRKLDQAIDQLNEIMPKLEALIKERDQLKDEVIRLQGTIIKLKHDPS